MTKGETVQENTKLLDCGGIILKKEGGVPGNKEGTGFEKGVVKRVVRREGS